MPVITAPYEFNVEDLFVDLRERVGRPLYLKCEGFNFAGSVKLKAALEMVRSAESSGVLRQDSVLVESSSGNLGVALSVIAASKGYRFVCVTDPRCPASTRAMMTALGATVEVTDRPDEHGGFLGSRIAHVRELCASSDRYVWLNQYTNPGNWQAHHRSTAPAIARRFPGLGVLFVGAGSTGTLMGCARYFRERSSRVRVVAVDTAGSVTFGGAPSPRLIPGLGASVPPPLLDESCVDDVVHVAEKDAVRACRYLAESGFLFGGSTGTVLSGALSWLEEHDPGRERVSVAIAPDLGERYLDTVYDEVWTEENLREAEVHSGSGVTGADGSRRYG